MYTFKRATPDDADLIADIIIRQSGGVVDHLIGNLVLGLSATDILSAFLMKGESPYSTENIIMAVRKEAIVGICFAYPASEHKIPLLMANYIPDKRLNAVRPVFESSIPDCLYINTFWVDDSQAQISLGQALLLEADSLCAMLGLSGLSKFCWNDDEEQMRFFSENGFALHQHLPKEMVPLEGHDLGGSILFRPVGSK